MIKHWLKVNTFSNQKFCKLLELFLHTHKCSNCWRWILSSFQCYLYKWYFIINRYVLIMHYHTSFYYCKLFIDVMYFPILLGICNWKPNMHNITKIVCCFCSFFTLTVCYAFVPLHILYSGYTKCIFYVHPKVL